MGKQENKSRESERAYSVIITAYVVCAGALILHLCCVYEWKYMQLPIFCGCVCTPMCISLEQFTHRSKIKHLKVNLIIAFTGPTPVQTGSSERKYGSPSQNQ